MVAGQQLVHTAPPASIFSLDNPKFIWSAKELKEDVFGFTPEYNKIRHLTKFTFKVQIWEKYAALWESLD